MFKLPHNLPQIGLDFIWYQGTNGEDFTRYWDGFRTCEGQITWQMGQIIHEMGEIGEDYSSFFNFILQVK